MKRLPKFENVWGKITTQTGKLFIITFNIKDKMYRLYCVNLGEYRFLDKSKDAIKCYRNNKKI